jgi:hypothetical protein
MTGGGERRTASGERPNDGTAARGQTDTTKWEYLGVGCFSALVGVGGGGMLAVMIAKIAGGLSKCTADQETGAPCHWFMYAVYGALAGLVLVPVVSLWLFRRGRARANQGSR